VKKTVLAAVAAGATLAATLTAGQGAGASTFLDFFGAAGGSQIRAFNNTITSDLTAASAISGPNSNATSTNDLADLTVSGVLTADNVESSAMSRKTLTGYQVTSKAETTHVSVLNGLITVNAVTTTAVAQLNGSKASSTVNTQLAGIHIAGVKLPLSIPKNFHVTIPDVASIVLNSSFTITQGTTTAGMGAGLAVTLLKPAGNNAEGATIYLSPVYSRLGDLDANNTGHTSQGMAFGSAVNAQAGTLVGVRSDPTAPVWVTPGKDGQTSLAAVNLSPALKLGAITNTSTGTQTTALGSAETTAKVASLNLFNGLITADAVSSDARVSAPTGSPVTVFGDSKLVNLVIAGHAIPVDVAPNTTINLLNFATVVVNRQVASANQMVVNAVYIKITTAAYNLPVGAQIQLAAAAASAS
jgi:hypothetical protein